MPIVDAHHHVWDLSVRDQPSLDQPGLAPLRRNFMLSDLEPDAAAEGVTSTVLVQTVTEPEETPEMLALAAGSDLIAGALLVGIRHPVLVEPDPDWLIRPAVLRGLADVAAAGLTFDVVSAPRHLRAAVAAAQATPQLTFVLDHFGNPEIGNEMDESWAAAFRAFAALPNTVAKFSGILGEPAPVSADAADTTRASGPTAHLQPYYEIALAGFGPGRLMFGSDWPVSTMMVGYGGVHAAARSLTADLSSAEKTAIFHDTAQRAYGLKLDR